MDSLPTEILGLILHWEVRMCERHKNTILHLRTVCKAFDLALRTYAFKTVQLEFSRFLRNVPTPDPQNLDQVGHICEALYLDMMVVRDEGMLGDFIETVQLRGFYRNFQIGHRHGDRHWWSKVPDEAITYPVLFHGSSANSHFQRKSAAYQVSSRAYSQRFRR